MGIPSPLAWDKYLDTYYKRSENKKDLILREQKFWGGTKFSFLLEKNNGTSISNSRVCIITLYAMYV